MKTAGILPLAAQGFPVFAKGAPSGAFFYFP